MKQYLPGVISEVQEDKTSNGNTYTLEAYRSIHLTGNRVGVYNPLFQSPHRAPGPGNRQQIHLL